MVACVDAGRRDGDSGAVAFGLTAEVRTSWLQSELLSRAVRSLTFRVEPGPSDAIRFPSAGPYDQRLGYVGLPAFIERLRAQGFKVEHQARLSARHLDAIDRGAFPIYHEKTAAGLAVLDHAGAELFGATYPERTYADYDAVPRLIIDSLLFIENRELLEEERGPTQSGDRVGPSGPGPARQLTKLLNPSMNLPGGSTLATQIEKYRHAPAGRTEDASKLRQMVSASLRAYREGPDTSAVRRQIVVDYLNSTPLSARTGFGEVNGLGDGLWAWFGTDFARANRLLKRAGARGCSSRPGLQAGPQPAARPAPALVLPDRRPRGDPRADRCASAPARRGARGRRRTRARALEAPLGFSPIPAAIGTGVRRAQSGQCHPHHAASAARPAGPASSTGWISRWRRRSICRPSGASPGAAPAERSEGRGRDGPLWPPPARRRRLRRPSDLQPDAVRAGAGVNYLRVQADNLDQPFDINQGAKLDLGSTAKLRT